MATSAIDSWSWHGTFLQGLIFPGDNTNLKVAFLKPHGGASPKSLARWRTFCFFWMAFQLLSRGILYPSNDLFWRFTNWNLVTNWLAYAILIISHVMNGDFFKDTYIEIDPSTVDDSKKPYFLWPFATAVYEYSFTGCLSVFIGFATVETPF